LRDCCERLGTVRRRALVLVHVHVEGGGDEVGVSGPDRAVHEAEGEFGIALRHSVQVSSEFPGRILLELGDGLVRDVHSQVEVITERDRVPVVVGELHADVGGFLARLDLEFSGPRSIVSVIGRDRLAAQRQGHALDFVGVKVVHGLHGVVAAAGAKDQQSRGRQDEWQFRLKMSHVLTSFG